MSGRPGDAILGGIGLSLNATLIWMITHGRLPDEPEDFSEAALESFLSMIPFVGGMINSLRQGYDAGLPAGLDILVKRSWLTLTEASKFFRTPRRRSDLPDLGKLMDNAAYVASLKMKIPYTQIRRTLAGLWDLTEGSTDDLRRLLWSEQAIKERSR